MDKLRHPPTLDRACVLVKAPSKKMAITAFYVCLYAVCLQWGATTCGETYEWALAEQKRIIREKALLAKEKGVSFSSGNLDRKESSLDVNYEELPSPYLPNAWACLFIFCCISIHALFHLLCHWSIEFKSRALFQPYKDEPTLECFLKIIPAKNKGVGAIVGLEESEITASLRCTFQSQLYEITPPGAADDELIGGDPDSDIGSLRLIQCKTREPLDYYRKTQGLVTEGQIEKAVEQYGTNVFELPRPTFWELYKKQLMSPIAIFQLFCAVLWMLDTYWKYTMFTFMSILGFEASTAFQRLKSMATLRGMGSKSYNVYVWRRKEWQEHAIEDLLPGDVISLHHAQEGEKKDQPKSDAPEDKKDAKDNKSLCIPADCFILRGSAVVNEASLTGESVPQMKDAVEPSTDGTERLDMHGKHRIHTLFSGTNLVQVTQDPRDANLALKDSSSKGESTDIPPPPNKGILACVLRTGFSSSQGELMRMIEFSTQDVGSDKKETALQLLFLLMFALAAAGYVLKKGLEDPEKPTYKTLLRCVLIITSVVPPSLPMQMAFAVHTALMSLLKAGIFCTEPYRVPFAGRVKYCFFDKTGTLTSDSMTACSIVNGSEKDSGGKGKAKTFKEASPHVAMVVAGCHSLIEVDGKSVGDPIEVAALRGIQWSFVAANNTAKPGIWYFKEKQLAHQKEYIAALPENDKDERESANKRLAEIEQQLKDEKKKSNKLSLAIEQRFHFSSHLQRMSTVCRVNSNESEVPSGVYVLTKGSPEAIAKLVGSKPSWYDATYTGLAEQGQRILALAWKRLSTDATGKLAREDCEKEMQFAGFASFKCETRKDSTLVIRSLNESAHECVMLTGDAPLTALNVAYEVEITRQKKLSDSLVLSEGEGGQLEWAAAFQELSFKPERFDPAKIKEHAKKYSLVVTGRTLELAVARDDVAAILPELHHICVFARLSPKQKEEVIRAISTLSSGKKEREASLMCGDGGNDVGALKEADVGLALLSGFGSANAGKKKEEEAAIEKADKDCSAEELLGKEREAIAKKNQEIAKKANEEFKRKQKNLMGKQQQWVEEEIRARASRGEDTGFMGQMAAMKTVMGKLKGELKQEQEQMQKKHGNAYAAGAAKLAGELDGMEELDMPMVQLGDASIAAPFTSRTPSISSTVDIVRQGRCTLLSAVQQMQIMMLESMISAYTLSAMSVDGTKPSEAQMMASGTLMSVASLAFSFARPVDRMHKVRPLGSIFHPAIFVSMMGQLLIHLGCMVYIAGLAKDLMGPEKLQEIVDFEKERNKKIDSMEESAFDEWNWFLSVPFKSNLLNTVVWLVESSQQISVLFVNYKGQPWMKGLLENQPLFLSLFGCVALVAVCAWGHFPYLNELLNLEVVPEELRPIVMTTLFVSLIGSFIWDRLCQAIFAPEIFEVTLHMAMTTTAADFIPLVKTVAYLVGGLMFLGTGNPILWGLGYMMYKNYKSTQAQKDGAPPPQAGPQCTIL